MFSLESSHRGDSNEYTIINLIKKITLNYSKYNNVCSYGIFCQGFKNEFETAVVNEKVESLKFYCTLFILCAIRKEQNGLSTIGLRTLILH